MSVAAESAIPAIVRTQSGLITTFRPTDSLSDETILEQLHQSIENALGAGETQIIVDLAGVPMLNSAALDEFLDFQDRLVRAGGWIKLSHASSIVREILRITDIDRYISIVGEETVKEEKSEEFTPLTERKRLGDLLVEAELVSSQQIKEAIALQEKTGKQLGNIVIAKGWVNDQDVLQLLSRQLGVPSVRLRSHIYDPAVVELLDRNVARRLKVLPLFKVRGVLFLATANPQATPILDEVEEHVGCTVRPVLAVREDILRAINERGPGAEYAADLLGMLDEDFEVVDNRLPDDYGAIDEMAGGSPVINLVNSLIQRAVKDGASDIHIEAFRTLSRIRYRIDGLLYEFQAPKIELHAPMVSRLKVMANLDIAERRLPQDGRIQVFTQGRSVDLRFSSLPGLHGEKVVLRVLDKNQGIFDLDSLGMSDTNLQTFDKLLKFTNGLILVTGPTGSGKTTSLYSALSFLNSIEKNIVTIEDPVEYQIDIINQNEVRNNIGLGFARILKHVLRQDPDIIMVGEIRERETAEIAVQAALTGHLVLSTLHTNDSVGAVTRMIDMGVEPYLLSSALIGVVAQRLVRTICPACRTESLAPPEIVERYGWQDRGKVRLARGRGCHECYDSGYKGRMGIHETLETDPDLQNMIMSNPGRDDLTAYMEKRGVVGLFQDGLERVLEGRTTIDEVSRSISF
jgi:type IV pilus assembly protein PilB